MIIENSENLIAVNYEQIIPAALGDHGFFIFQNLPPDVNLDWPDFGYVKEAKTGDILNPCWGTCRNGVPLILPAADDYFGFVFVDKDTMEQVQGYYIDTQVPAYEYVIWFGEKKAVMPDKDWNLICYVGYHPPGSTALYMTDYREFTIKNSKKKSWWWLLLAIPVIPLLSFLMKKLK